MKNKIFLVLQCFCVTALSLGGYPVLASPYKDGVYAENETDVTVRNGKIVKCEGILFGGLGRNIVPTCDGYQFLQINSNVILASKVSENTSYFLCKEPMPQGRSIRCSAKGWIKVR